MNAPIVPPRSRPHGERRLLEHMKENQAGNALVLVVTRFAGDSPDTEGLTLLSSGFQTLIQNNALSDDDATMVTCSLGVENTPPVSSALAVPQNVIARAKFGVGGALHVAYISVRQGTQFTVPATTFQLDMIALASAAVVGEPRGIACLDYGTRPGSFEAPTFDLFRASDGPPQIVSCVVPPFARHVSVLASVPGMLSGGAGTTLTVVQGGLAVSPAVNSLTDPSRLRAVPLPYSPSRIELFNGSALAGTYFISFALGLLPTAYHKRSHTEGSRVIPVLINNRNRLTWLRAMMGEIVRMGGTPIVLDNASTYPPLLEWYLSREYAPVHVLPLLQNGGPRGFWEKPAITSRVCDHLADGFGYDLTRRPFLFTDPDLDLSACPDETLRVLVKESQVRGAKVGVALNYQDIPKHYPLRELVEKIEAEYWKESVGYCNDSGPRGAVWRAGVDTTLAAYSSFSPFTLEGFRLGFPYTAKHLPWYANPATVTEEERYYALHCELPVHSNICPDRENGVAVGIAALKARYR